MISNYKLVYSLSNSCYTSYLGIDGNPTVLENRALRQFLSPQELWACYKKYNGIETEQAEQTALSSYFFDAAGRSPRYYQRIAINRTVEAIARGQNRILLVMATGTGKTYTAFQIIYRLWKSGNKKKDFISCRQKQLDYPDKEG